MKAQINPAWLVSLMCQWVKKGLATESKALGYPKKACGFSEKTTGGYNHSDPTAFSARDFSELEAAIARLYEDHKLQCIAFLMYYKPWTVAAMVAEGHDFNNSTYYKRLHAAHAKVAEYMDKNGYP